MSSSTPTWELLSFPKPEKLNPSIEQLHHASQFVALIANSLLPKAAGDSQANLGWHFEKKGLEGREVEANQKFRAFLDYTNFELQLLDGNDHVIASLAVHGQSKTELLHWLKAESGKLGVSPENLHPISHFSIPDHPTDTGASFELISKEQYEELARYRHNAQLILEEFAQKFEHGSSVRIWPHHFDTGPYIPLSFDEAGKENKSLGLGFAIPAGTISELYFYVYFWSKAGNENLSNLPELASNGIWITEGWKGAALKVSDVLGAKTAEGQYQLVHDFFLSAINSQLELINASDLKLKKN